MGGVEAAAAGGERPGLAVLARQLLESAWRGDHCVPNPSRYPWQWLWDSCFHAVVWAHLGDERAGVELAAALSSQAADGFVPHIRYAGGAPVDHARLWGRADASSITQPPMVGHAIAEMHRHGLDVAPELVERATAALAFLLRRRRRSPGGLIQLCHPWESGCDDSPRWDSTCEAWSPRRWRVRKGELIGTIERSRSGSPLSNPGFAVGSVGFNALVAFNARELAGLTGDGLLTAEADELADALEQRWEPTSSTWLDDGATEGASGAVRTLDALLPCLVGGRGASEALAQLVDTTALGARFGPCGVHRDEPCFAPDTYWRGSAWPQLTYLFWVAALRRGDAAVASSLGASLQAGAWRSNWAEHWHPDAGSALGARPQTWSALAAVVGEGAEPAPGLPGPR